MASSPAPGKVTLNDGNQIPIVGLGTWQSPPGQVYQAVLDAIDAGYRHLDCAYVYQNEGEIGKAITLAIESGKVKREELFVVSKCWLTFYKKERVEMCCRRSLEKLRLSYIDLYLIHWPLGFKDDDEALFPESGDGTVAFADNDFIDTWKGMEEMVRKGLVKSIGISNFNSQQIERLLKEATIKPVTNQIECHPFLPQNKLKKFCEDLGITITAYSPLGSSIPAPTSRSGCPVDKPSLIENPVILELAAKHKKSSAQILIKYQIQRGVICIPKSVTKSRIMENIQLFEFELSQDDVSRINSVENGFRYLKFDIQGVDKHPDYPFNIEF